MVNATKLPLPKLKRGARQSSKKNLAADEEPSTTRESNASSLASTAAAATAATPTPTSTPAESKPKKGILSKLLHKQPKVGKKTRYLFPKDVESTAVIDEIIQDKGVVSLEVEGLIVDKNCRSLANNLNLALALSDREWQSISFLDVFAPEEFITWRGHKHAVTSSVALDQVQQVQFRANIEFPPGTSIKTFMDTLRNINQHNLVQSVDFFGALYNCQKNTIIHTLEDNVDDSGAFMNTVRLEVVCGLEESNAKFELVEMCLQKSRDMVNKAMADGSGKKNQSSKTANDTDPESSNEFSSKNNRRVRHAHGRRPAATTSTRRSRVTAIAPDGTPAQAVPLPVSENKPRRTARKERRQAVLPSPISVAEIYNGKENKDLGEMFNSSLPSLLSMPDDVTPTDEMDKLHFSSSDFSTSEGSEATSSSHRRSDRSDNPARSHRRRTRGSRKSSQEARRKRRPRSVSVTRSSRLSSSVKSDVK